MLSSIMCASEGYIDTINVIYMVYGLPQYMDNDIKIFFSIETTSSLVDRFHPSELFSFLILK